MINDTVSDMLTRIRNSNLVKHSIVGIPYTKIIENIAHILKEEGFISGYEKYTKDSHLFLLILLKYKTRKHTPVISEIKRVSKPGLRIYTSTKGLPKVLGPFGIAIISTSQGLMTNTKAKQLGIGGEILCYIF